MKMNVICRTEDCVSNGLVTELVDPQATVVCGYCGNEITDKTEVVQVSLEPGA